MFSQEVNSYYLILCEENVLDKDNLAMKLSAV